MSQVSNTRQNVLVLTRGFPACLVDTVPYKKGAVLTLFINNVVV